VNELRGEKIDIIKWNEEPTEFIASALSPAKVVSVEILDGEKGAQVIVPDYQLSLAIGKEGQNARLAAKLTGWKIDIKSESQINQLMEAVRESNQQRGEWLDEEEWDEDYAGEYDDEQFGEMSGEPMEEPEETPEEWPDQEEPVDEMESPGLELEPDAGLDITEEV
jgi:N utilization substance protein A